MSVTLACPEKCTCNNNIVRCKKKNFESLPVNIPKDTVHLSLREKKISKILENGILNDLIYLEGLNLSRNQPQYIPRKSFQYLKKSKNLQSSEKWENEMLSGAGGGELASVLDIQSIF